MLALFVKLFYQWIFLPLRVLIQGSRKVASGEFTYRIHLDAHDEMSELAAAMNDMTSRFQAIRDDLDRQVQDAPRKSCAASNWPASAFWPRASPMRSTIRWHRSHMCPNRWKGAWGGRARDDEQLRVVMNIICG